MQVSLNTTGITFQDGTQQQTAAVTTTPYQGPGGFASYNSASNGTNFTVPAGITSLIVTVFGGGGSGYCNGTGYYGTGGNGGVAKALISVTPGQNILMTIGAGGASRASTGVGNAGGTTQFGTYLSATGGAGGPNGPPGAQGAGTVQQGTKIFASTSKTGSTAPNIFYDPEYFYELPLFVGGGGPGGYGSTGGCTMQYYCGGGGGFNGGGAGNGSYSSGRPGMVAGPGAVGALAATGTSGAGGSGGIIIQW